VVGENKSSPPYQSLLSDYARNVILFVQVVNSDSAVNDHRGVGSQREDPMYIGLGTLVLIVVIVLLVMMMRGRRR
jgi:hypothetical protein